MAGGNSLQPFDRHPADSGALEAAAGKLSDQAAQAIDANRLTFYAFMPAVSNWDGIASAELRAAPRPVRERAFEVSDSLAWAAMALRYWAGRVSAFNTEVSGLVDELLSAKAQIFGATQPNGDPVPMQTTLDAAAAVDAQAKKAWHELYETYIRDGATTAAGMLNGGPSSANVSEAAAVGLVPPGAPWNPLSQMWNSFRNNFLPPSEYGPLDPWAWGASRFFTGLGYGAGAFKNRYGIPWTTGGPRRREFSGPRVHPRYWNLVDRAAKAAKHAGNLTSFLNSLTRRLRDGQSVPGAVAGATGEAGTAAACARAGAAVPVPHLGAKIAIGIGAGALCTPPGRVVGDGFEQAADNLVEGFKGLGRLGTPFR
ncbi:MAG TPA: hypothetical protein VF062_11785 [Candidatus Limnocylindrales bacterium]